MINFEKQFESIQEKYKEIETNLNNQLGFDSEKLVKLNKEYAELKPIVDTIILYKDDKKELFELAKLIEDEDSSIKEIAEIELKEKKKSTKILKEHDFKTESEFRSLRRKMDRLEIDRQNERLRNQRPRLLPIPSL